MSECDKHARSDERIRAAYEVWALGRNLSMARKGDGYRGPYTEWCWHAFYAASRLADELAAPVSHARAPTDENGIPTTGGPDVIPSHDPSAVYGLPMTEARIVQILGERFDPYSENFRKARKAIWAILHEVSRAAPSTVAAPSRTQIRLLVDAADDFLEWLRKTIRAEEVEIKATDIGAEGTTERMNYLQALVRGTRSAIEKGEAAGWKLSQESPPTATPMSSIAPPEGESRWLIERTYAKGEPAERREFWLGATPGDIFDDSFNGSGNGGVWTTNALEAARFSSLKIAEKLRYRHFHPEAPVEACEHLFQCGTASPSARAAIAPPTDAEVSAYRDLFRVELDKNMNNSSGSPSTDAHRVALRGFVEARNKSARTDGGTNG